MRRGTWFYDVPMTGGGAHAGLSPVIALARSSALAAAYPPLGLARSAVRSSVSAASSSGSVSVAAWRARAVRRPRRARTCALAGSRCDRRALGVGDDPLYLAELGTGAVARLQRLPIVELEDELEPVAQGLDRVEQPKARAVCPGGQRRAAEHVGQEAGGADDDGLGKPERIATRVSTGVRM